MRTSGMESPGDFPVRRSRFLLFAFFAVVPLSNYPSPNIPEVIHQ